MEASPESLPAEAAGYLRQRAWDWREFESWWGSLDSSGSTSESLPLDPSEVLNKHGFFWDDGDGAYSDLLNILPALPKPDLIRTLLLAAEVEIYERALTAEAASGAEVATAAIRAWLKDPTSGILQEEAREAGARATGLLVGAVAIACARMPDMAAKTCLDALGSLPSELRTLAYTRIRGALQR